MTLGTLLQFLVGRASAIRRIASCPDALWFGLVMVLLAGIPREYDQEYLVPRFWMLLVPVCASALTATILFTLLRIATPRWRALGESPWGALRVFLTVYWMTGPLAWFYAIPAEHLLDVADSVRLNLSLLGMVAAWRVLLITRVISVLYGLTYVRAFLLVALFADTLVLIVLQFTRIPIFNIMGGIHLTESEQIILDVACATRVWGIVTMPIWLIGSLVVWYAERRGKASDKPAEPFHTSEPRPRVSLGLWGFAVLLLAGGLAMIYVAQPAQQRRHHAESLLRDEQVEAGLAFMSQHPPHDFPPHWDPPPQTGYGEKVPSLLQMAEVALRPDTADWVRQLVMDKYHRHFKPFYSQWYWTNLSEAELITHLDILLVSWPDDPDISMSLLQTLERQAEKRDSDVIRQRVAELRQRHGQREESSHEGTEHEIAE